MGLNISRIETTTPFPKIRIVLVRLRINPDVCPKVQPYRRIPIALEEKIEKKLNEALALDIIEKVEESHWASPMVIVLKDDKDIRLCVAYACKSLTDPERRYLQTEKEALALVWSVERFYIYLCGITFELETDHKPLEAIFKPTSTPCARIARWVLRLQSYKFKIIYRQGNANIADCLSRLSQLPVSVSFDNSCEFLVNANLNGTELKALSIQGIQETSS